MSIYTTFFFGICGEPGSHICGSQTLGVLIFGICGESGSLWTYICMLVSMGLTAGDIGESSILFDLIKFKALP